MSDVACYCGACYLHDNALMEAQAPGESESKTEDVRATKPHEVTVTLTVQAEDAGKAVAKVLVAVGENSVTKLSVKSSEDGMWA